MSKTEYLDRFSGIERLYGKGSLEFLNSLHVYVIGLGGVGSWAVESLARTGLGELTLIDYDTVSQSNINRQLPALDETIGEKKSRILKGRIHGINPECKCHIIDDFITLDNIPEYLSPDNNIDYVIDAIDSIKFKTGIIAYCKRNKLPIVTTGGAGGLTDPDLVTVRDLSRTINDPLIAKIRSRLRSEYGFSRNTKRTFGIDCVFSTQRPLYPRPDGSVSHEKPGIHGVSLDCTMGYGSAAYVTASFGNLAASVTINKSLKKFHRKHEIDH